MKLRYTLTEEDLLQFNLYHWLNSATLNKNVRRIRWTNTIFIFLGGMILSVVLFHEEPIIFLCYNAFVAVMAGVYFLRYPRSHKTSLIKNSRAMYQEGQRNEFIGPRTLELLENSLVTHNSVERHEHVYGLVERVVEHNQSLYIYLGSLTAHIVPDAAFTDPGQRGRFLEALEKGRQAYGLINSDNNSHSA